MLSAQQRDAAQVMALVPARRPSSLKQTPSVGLVVLFSPVDGGVGIDSINSVRFTSTLGTLVPSRVIEVRNKKAEEPPCD